MHILALLLTLSCRTLVSGFAYTPDKSQVAADGLQSRDIAGKLENFQVYPPVLTVNPEGGLEVTDGSSGGAVDAVPSKEPTCQQTLVTYSFGSSYGKPFVGPYTPPSCSFNRVTWNLTATSAGRQFDRLGSVSFGDIELFRSSTAEPTVKGIQWTYLKDMTPFLSLMKKPNTIIFDLGNIITDVYTGYINVTLTASYFTADDSITPADLIVPISSKRGSEGQPSYFTVPPETATSDVTLPRNIKKAVVSIAATGQATEEFWWSNVLQSQIDAFPSYGTIPGYSPFREAELLIDGSLAGVAWPFPVIFTGGVVPGLWRPIAGIDAFDLKEDEIDITPWLPLLCDGKAHSFEIVVSGLNDTGTTAVLSKTTGSNFWVDGKIFIWLDEDASHITTGTGPRKSSPLPDIRVSSSIHKDNAGVNQALDYTVDVRRQLLFTSEIKFSTGNQNVFWAQSLTFSASGNYTQQGNVTVNDFHSGGYEVSSSGYARQFGYPLNAVQDLETANGNLTITADVKRGKDVKTLGEPAFPTGLEAYFAVDGARAQQSSFQGASLSTTQNGTAFFTEDLKTLASSGYGSTTQDMTFSGIQVRAKPSTYGFPTISGGDELFHRHVMAVNATVVEDEETLVRRPINRPKTQAAPSAALNFALSGGPGRSNAQSLPPGTIQQPLQ